MRLLLSGGGTGGHVYPALAVVQEWKSATGTSAGLPPLEAVLYVGTAGGLEASIVPRAGVPLRVVQAAALRGLSPWRVLVNSMALVRGTMQAWGILRDFRPDVVLATGGYASAPVGFAAWLRRRPVLVYLPDVMPGMAVRLLSRLARRVAVSFEAALGYLPPGKGVVTGYPVRGALYGRDKRQARQRLNLDASRKMLLVLGGSRGAHSINVAISAGLPSLCQLAQIIHVTGEKDHAWLQERRLELPAETQAAYHVFSYLHEEMVDALVAADLAIARAGAATMGEFAAVGLPSILVPYPYSGQHQNANAAFMANHGAAVVVQDSALSDGALTEAVAALLTDEGALGTMAAKARELARPDAALAIARELASLSGGV